MARPNKIWFRKDRNSYYVTIDGRTHKLGSDKDVAEKAFHKLKAADGPPPASISVATLLDNFLQWVKANRAQGTFNTYTHYLQGFLDSLSNPSMEARRVKPFNVTEWIKPSWSKSYQTTAVTALQRAYKWGMVQGYISESPIAIFEKAGRERRDNCPTKKDYDAMLEHAAPAFKRLLMFVWETGARPQEARAIEGRHLHGDRIIFPVIESKGKKHKRVIYLNDNAKALIEQRDGKIFVNRSKRPWTKDAINNAMCRIAEKTGHKYALYDLRHAWVTRMLEAGLDHLTVAKLAGHRDASMIARHYAHIGEKNDYLLEQLKRVS
ncbi:MAG: tyrosine-type recombinase/integrase [Pirellulaceae bacterium]|nr:tyrosine-type recombinase/integrase [Pirellulaceae bacterium]